MEAGGRRIGGEGGRALTLRAPVLRQQQVCPGGLHGSCCPSGHGRGSPVPSSLSLGRQRVAASGRREQESLPQLAATAGDS